MGVQCVALRAFPLSVQPAQFNTSQLPRSHIAAVDESAAAGGRRVRPTQHSEGKSFAQAYVHSKHRHTFQRLPSGIPTGDIPDAECLLRDQLHSVED